MQLDGKTTKLNTLVLFASVTLLITSTPLSEVPAADATVSNLITIESFQKISDIDGGFTGLLKNGDRFGRSADNIGDLDGDGVTDVAIGAGSDNDGGNNRGAVWILFLNNDGTVKSHQKISDTQGNFTGILENYDRFGESLVDIGDLDGDGVTDLVVGAAHHDEGGADTGAVWILFLNNDGTVKSHQKISVNEGNFTGVLDPDTRFGSSVENMGDFDGDGMPDFDLLDYEVDKVADTYWSQVLGEAIKGELSGTKLSLLPSDQMRFGKWKKQFPKGEVLSIETGALKFYGSNPYGDYFKVQDFSSFMVSNTNEALAKDAFVFGLEVDGKFKAYSTESIKKLGELNDLFNGNTFVLQYEENLDVIRVYKKLSNGNLERVNPISGFWFSWVAAHPNTELYK